MYDANASCTNIFKIEIYSQVYILHNNCYIKSSVMYATSLQNKHIFSPGFEPQTSEVGVECVTTVPPCC